MAGRVEEEEEELAIKRSVLEVGWKCGSGSWPRDTELEGGASRDLSKKSPKCDVSNLEGPGCWLGASVLGKGPTPRDSRPMIAANCIDGQGSQPSVPAGAGQSFFNVSAGAGRATSTSNK